MTLSATSAPGSTPAAARPRLGQPQIAQCCAALIAVAVVLFAPQVLNDGDTWWHLAAGEWMLAHGQVLHRDVFSFSHYGLPWETHEWLSEVVMALAFRAGGWSGLLLLFAATSAAAAGLLARGVSRSLGGISLLLVLVLAAACVAPSLLTRPHLLVLPILIAWTMELLAAREAGRGPRLYLAGLMLAWANLHGSYVFGFVLFAPFALEALVASPGRRLAVVRDWGLVGGLCAAATLATPHGWEALLYPFQIMTMHNLNAIVEWRAADFSKVTAFEISLIVTLFVGLSRGVRIAPLRLAALLFMLHMALQHDRHLIVLAVTAPLLLAKPFAEALGQAPSKPSGGRIAWLAFILGAVVLAGLRLANPAVRVDAATTPVTALAHVPAALASRPVINSYGFGGYLIFQGVRPFIDGRSDMYGDAYFARFLRIVAGDPASFDQAVERDHIAWTLLAPGEPLVRVLDSRPGWRRLYADRYAVVHVRTDAAARDGQGAPAR